MITYFSDGLSSTSSLEKDADEEEDEEENKEDEDIFLE